MAFSYQEEFEVPVPPARVFEHIGTNFFANHGRWDPMIVRMEQTSAGPIGVGTTGREWRKIGLRSMPNDVRVLEFDPVGRFAFEATSGPLRERVVNTIVPAGGGSRVGVDLTFTPASRGMRMAEPLMRRIVLRNVRRNVVRLRDAVIADAA